MKNKIIKSIYDKSKPPKTGIIQEFTAGGIVIVKWEDGTKTVETLETLVKDELRKLKLERILSK